MTEEVNDMPVNDDIRAEKSKFKNMTVKEKLRYIWDYYRIPIIIGIIGVVFIFTLVKDIISNNRETYLSACILNSNYTYETDTTLVNEYVNYSGVDTEAMQLNIDFSMHIDLNAADQMSLAYQQKVMALFAAKEIDVMVGDQNIIDSYASAEAFCNLTELLPADLAAELEQKGYTYYTATYENGSTVPVGLYMDSCVRLKNDDTYKDGVHPIFTISANAPHPEHAIEFLRFLISRD